MTVTNKPGRRGEHEISRKTIAQGMPVETGEPVEDYRILCGHGCIGHPAFPAPSLFLGAERPCRTRAQRVGRTMSPSLIVIPGRAKREPGIHNPCAGVR